MTEERLYSPAAERNRDPILEVLRRVLPASGRVLEVAAGTGQHAAHFAAHLPGLTWCPSEPDAAGRASVAAWCEGLPNVESPVALDVTGAWEVGPVDAIYCANMVHIAPWEATVGLLAGAAGALPERQEVPRRPRGPVLEGTGADARFHPGSRRSRRAATDAPLRRDARRHRMGDRRRPRGRRHPPRPRHHHRRDRVLFRRPAHSGARRPGSPSPLRPQLPGDAGARNRSGRRRRPVRRCALVRDRSRPRTPLDSNPGTALPRPARHTRRRRETRSIGRRRPSKSPGRRRSSGARRPPPEGPRLRTSPRGATPPPSKTPRAARRRLR